MNRSEKIMNLLEQAVTKRFFIKMADMIKNFPDPIPKSDLVHELVQIFLEENPRFDAERFRKAAGL